jgi:hypothetical protein
MSTCGKADHYVKEPEIDIRVGKASRGAFSFSNPSLNTSVVGVDSSPEHFQVQYSNLLGCIPHGHCFQQVRSYGIE